jgi:hypothetical protein
MEATSEPVIRHRWRYLRVVRDFRIRQRRTAKIRGVFTVMPFLLLIVGFIAIVSALRGTYADLGKQVVSDLQGSSGSPGYLYWVASLIIVGAIGYYSPLQKFSRAFMFLILLGMVLAAYKKNNQVFAQIFSALQNPSVGAAPAQSSAPQAQASTPQAQSSAATPSSNVSSITSSDLTSTALDAGKIALEAFMFA